MKAIISGATLAVMMIILASVSGGCASDRPQAYGRERPPIDQLNENNGGLQSKDLVSATDQMATDLLSVPELNASDRQWKVVITNVENRSQSPMFSYEVFSQRLRSKLSALGRGRVALIENRDKYKGLQSKELEQGADEFGQGGGRVQPGPVGQNPDYGLYITIDEMPNRATSYYLITATLTNLGTRQQVWVSPNPYEVNVAR